MPCLNILNRVLRKKDPSSQENKDFTPIAIFISTSLKIKHFEYEHFEANFFPLIPSSHLRNNHPTAIAPILGHHLKQAS